MKKKLDTNMYVYFGSEHYDRELFKNERDDNDMNSVSKYDYFCFRINNNSLALENIDDIK